MNIEFENEHTKIFKKNKILKITTQTVIQCIRKKEFYCKFESVIVSFEY